MAKELQTPNTFFIYDCKDGKPAINAPFLNDTMWMTQNQIAQLFDTVQGNVSKHIANVYSDGELSEVATYSKSESVQNEGQRQILRKLDVYSLDMVIAVGYRVNSKKATEFRIWATKVLHEYIQKGFALDDERLKMGYKFDKNYFRELRERIKDIRISERMFYQQIKDIYAMSADYNHDIHQTLNFFATVQNKVLFAITGKTAAELVFDRVDAGKEKMGLVSYKNAPDGHPTKQDVPLAKNYLDEPEIKEMRYIVNMFLDFAEHKADTEEVVFMKDWEIELDKFLTRNEKMILTNAGKISHAQMLERAYTEYAKYKSQLKITEKQESELEYRADIKELEKVLKDAE